MWKKFCNLSNRRKTTVKVKKRRAKWQQHIGSCFKMKYNSLRNLGTVGPLFQNLAVKQQNSKEYIIWRWNREQLNQAEVSTLPPFRIGGFAWTQVWTLFRFKNRNNLNFTESIKQVTCKIISKKIEGCVVLKFKRSKLVFDSPPTLDVKYHALMNDLIFREKVAQNSKECNHYNTARTAVNRPTDILFYRISLSASNAKKSSPLHSKMEPTSLALRVSCLPALP